jgi:hypothetical protein
MSKAVNSIDDILNASDSDEDVGNRVNADDVDLELLLEDDDDDDDEGTPRTHRGSLGSKGKAVVAATSSSSTTVPTGASKNTHTPSSVSSSLSVAKPTTAIGHSASTSSAGRSASSNLDIEKLLAGDDDLETPTSTATAAVSDTKLATNKSPSAGSTSTNFDLQAKLRSLERDSPYSLPSLKTLSLDQTITEVEKDEESATGDEHLASLVLAEKREHRYLMAGIRDVISALQSKRRREDGSSSNNLKCVEMDIVSTQLRKNASFRNHGPGVATVISIHAKFIAVGTSRGLILLFDHEQEIRQVIGSAVGATARCTAAVSAIDINTAGSMVLCGYDTGEVALWDVVKGSLLKRITDAHSFPICRLRILLPIGDGYPGPGAGAGISSSSDIFVITVDVRGSVHRIKINKMLWTSYVSEAECLLDGSAGAVTDMDVLPPFQPPAGMANEYWATQVGLGASNQFVAINSLTRTLVVHIHPSIKIRFRWPAPPGSHDPVSGGIMPEVVSSVAWSWVNTADCVFAPVPAPVPASAESADAAKPSSTVAYAAPPSVKTHYPVLARPWGGFVQLLVVYPVGGKEDSFQCCLLAEKEFANCKFLGVKWLAQGTTMALITFSEVLSSLPNDCNRFHYVMECRFIVRCILFAETWK